MSVQGCGSKEAAADTTTTAAATEAVTEAATEKATEAETTKAAAEAGAGETGIPAQYEPYLDWTETEWSAASEEEKKEALVAYVLYESIVYQGITDLTADDVVNEPEFEQLMPIVETGLMNVGGFSLKEICDMGNSAVAGLADLDDDVIKKLQCTAADWAGADDAAKKEVVSAMMIVGGKMVGQEITMEMIDSLSDSDLQAQVDTINAMFESGMVDDDVTLYEMLMQQ